MATWEDGPEYAPGQRPDQFTGPDVAPLQDPPPAPGPPAAPAQRPQFGNPGNPVAPLTMLVPEAGQESRDPRAPYQVDPGTMTGSGGAWGATYWRPPSQSGTPATGTANPGTGPATAAGPTQAVAVTSGPDPSQGSFPAPGTPGWFAPGPAPSPPKSGPPPKLSRATPWPAVIALGCAVFFVTAPFAFGVGFLLSLLTKYAKRQLMITWAVVGGSIILISTMSTLSNYGDLSDWYGVFRTWSLLGSFLMIILILLIINHEIQQYPQTGSGGSQQGPPNGPQAPGSSAPNQHSSQPPAAPPYPPPPGTAGPPPNVSAPGAPPSSGQPPQHQPYPGQTPPGGGPNDPPRPS